MIDWQPLIPQTPFPSQFFISYRSVENRLAEAVEDALQKSGQTVWRDRRSMQPSDDWKHEIYQSIDNVNDIVVLLTERAAESQQIGGVLDELATAVEHEKRVHCFSTFDDLKTKLPKIYSLIGHLNIENLPHELRSEDVDPRTLARYVVNRLLAPEVKTHPLELRDFERLACRTIFPRFHTISRQGRFDRDLLIRYSF